MVEGHNEKSSALKNIEIKINSTVKWLKSSGLKVNEQKTEMCIFHRNKNTDGHIEIDNLKVTSKAEMNVLGLTFDSRLSWSPQVARAIKNANASLQAIRMIRKFFNTNEIIQLLTSNFYSRLYYGSEIWQIPSLGVVCKKQLLTLSANALKLCNNYYDPSISYINLHKKYNRALPNEFCNYKLCLLMYKLYNEKIPKKEWLNLNFQIVTTTRQRFFEVQNDSNFKVGNNIITNRLSCLNKKINLELLNLPLPLYKMLCKRMYLI